MNGGGGRPPRAYAGSGAGGDVTVKSNAAGFPIIQFAARTSAGRVWRSSDVKPYPTSTCALMQALLHDSANTSRSLLWRMTTSPPCLHVKAWWPLLYFTIIIVPIHIHKLKLTYQLCMRHWRCGAHQLGTMMHAGIELHRPFMISSSETQVFW